MLKQVSGLGSRKWLRSSEGRKCLLRHVEEEEEEEEDQVGVVGNRMGGLEDGSTTLEGSNNRATPATGVAFRDTLGGNV